MKLSSAGPSLLAASASVVTGCVLLLALGAPQRMVVMQAFALVIGLSAAVLLGRLPKAGSLAGDGLAWAGAVAILLVAMIGERADGVARWWVVAGMTLQPALIAVPLVVLGFARRPAPGRVAAVAVAALGCALQPDLGAASMLALGVAGSALFLRTSSAAAAMLLAFAGFGAALWRPVDLPPVPFVEDVIPTALASGVLPATLLLAAVALLFLPALLVARRARPALTAAFAGTWLAGFMAALYGPYPTPVVGFGSSAVLGYLLSVALLALPGGRR